MTPLAALVRSRIAEDGPMRLDAYMGLALGHPTLGYYATRDPLGAAGDFTTAPEISQMFGELVGLWLVQAWIDQGRPDPFVLAEFGPGRGTLMRDALRASRAVPAFLAAALMAGIWALAVVTRFDYTLLAPTGGLTGENALLLVGLTLPLAFTGAGRWSLDSMRTDGRP